MPRKPLQVPDDFWSRDQVQTALRARDVSGPFRLLRKYAGASQTQTGAAVGMEQGYVSKVMNGHRTVITIDLLERIAEGLRMPSGARLLLGLAPTPGEPASYTPVTQTANSAITGVVFADDRPSSQATLLRTLLVERHWQVPKPFRV